MAPGPRQPQTAAAQEPPAALTKEARDKMTADQIIAKWKEGNLRFREGRKIERDFLAEQKATAAGQFPAGVLLSCIDSRAPAEILFNLGMGDVFNARIAGNVENPDILGSMEFTTKLAGAKVILVMGHSACGAVAGAIANAKLGNLTQLLAKIQPAIKATTYSGDRSAGNAEFVDAVARKNVELTMANIRKHSKCDRRAGEGRRRQDRRLVLRLEDGGRRVLRVSPGLEAAMGATARRRPDRSCGGSGSPPARG